MPIPEARLFPTSDGVPNNPTLPVLIYRAAVPADADLIEARLAANGWECRWRDGVFDFHHFHSTAHEALTIARGTVRLLIGGEGGADLGLMAGDVLVLPAGTGHKRIEASPDLVVIGAYPPGQDYAIERPDAAGLRRALDAIARVPIPPGDPVDGPQGALTRLWKG